MNQTIKETCMVLLIIILITGLIIIIAYPSLNYYKKEKLENDIANKYCQELGYDEHRYFTDCVNCYVNDIGKKTCDLWGYKINKTAID